LHGSAPYPAYARFRTALDQPVVLMLPRKCASNAVKYALWAQMGGVRNPELDYVGVGALAEAEWTVGFVRDPVERLRSCWRDKIMTRWMPSLAQWGMAPGMPFAAFAGIVIDCPDENSNRHFRSLGDELVVDGKLPSMLIDVKDLEGDWADLETLFGWPHLGIQRRNSTHARLLDHESSSLLTDAIRRRYAGDYALLEEQFLRRPREMVLPVEEGKEGV